MINRDLSSPELEWRPRLNAGVFDQAGSVALKSEFEEAEIVTALPKSAVAAFLGRINGNHTTAQLLGGDGPLSGAAAMQMLSTLDNLGFLDDADLPHTRSGLDVLLELEDLTNEILYRTLYQNIFWQRCKAANRPEDIPSQVMHGLVIENYHFLFRESYFDAPVLSYVGNTAARLAMNAFFAEENGHDELLLKSLNSIGLSREDLFQMRPLPETMALINALAYWAHNDPIFFFTTLGVLEGKDIKEDSFIAAAERMGLEKSFIGPVKAHSNLNLDGEHGNLTRQIFSSIPCVDIKTVDRLRAQTHLFIELYDNFFTAIWNHYSATPDLRARGMTRLLEAK